jgi:hypothetical protein
MLFIVVFVILLERNKIGFVRNKPYRYPLLCLVIISLIPSITTYILYVVPDKLISNVVSLLFCVSYPRNADIEPFELFMSGVVDSITIAVLN